MPGSYFHHFDQFCPSFPLMRIFFSAATQVHKATTYVSDQTGFSENSDRKVIIQTVSCKS